VSAIRSWFVQEVGADVAVMKILDGCSVQELVDDVVAQVTAELGTGS
jgi:hypothetical protein